MDFFYQFFLAFCEYTHWVVFIAWLYAFYRSVRYKYNPYSQGYIGVIIMVQCVYNGCPIASLQDYQAALAGQKLIGNEFLGNIFQNYTDISRVIFFLISCLLFYSAYAQFQKLDIKPKYWFRVWNEGVLNAKKFNPEMLV